MSHTPIDTGYIETVLQTNLFGRPVHYLQTAGSTNAEAKALLERGNEPPFIVVSEEQTGGRGRMRRSWFSPAMRGIWMTVVFPESDRMENPGHYNFCMSVAIARGIKSVTGIDIEFKWPNDLLISGKKVCGILSENSAAVNNTYIMIAGAGLNVNIEQDEFPQEIRNTATSLQSVSRKQVDRTALLLDIITDMNAVYTQWRKTGIEPVFEEWLHRCTTPGKTVRISAGKTTVEGIAKRIAPDGTLFIETPDGGEKKIIAGDLEYTIDRI